jgi:hypothetical protein
MYFGEECGKYRLQFTLVFFDKINKKLSGYNESYVQEIRLCACIIHSIIVNLKNDHNPANEHLFLIQIDPVNV